MNVALDYFIKGGLCMYPLLLCSIIALAISIERFYSLKRASAPTRKN